MSAKSKRISSLRRKSSIRKSALVSTANRELKNSVASESDAKPLNTSMSSVFSDDEVVFIETKKKKARSRTKKVRNTEDLRDCFKEPQSGHSVDSDTDLITGEIKSTKALAEVGINTVSNAIRDLKNSGASESDSKPINTSFSSGFTDNEAVFVETKKKQARRTKKVRNTEDLRDCFKEPRSGNSVDSEADLRRDKIKSTNALSEIFLSKSKNIKKKKKPLFCLPDVTYLLKSGSTDTADESVKAKSKKKIRYTQDLNAIANDQRVSDVAAKPRPKRTKKARLPSFLPQVDIVEEKKKLNKSNSAESAVADSDNKENDTESTDSEKYCRKTRPRKANRRLVKNEEKMSLDTKELAVPSNNTNKSVNAEKSKNDSFEIIHSPYKSSTNCNYVNSQVTEELTTPGILKRNTSRFSDQKASNTPNKTGNTSDFNNECASLCVEDNISLKKGVSSVRKSSRRSAFNMTSDLTDTSDKAAWFNRTRESSVSNLELFTTASKPSKETTFNMPLNLEETTNEPKATSLIKSRRSTRNQDSNCTIESNAVNSRTSTRTSNANNKRFTFEVQPGLELSISKSKNLDDPFERAINNESSKDTYDLVSSTHSTMTSDEDPATNNTVIDLTESPRLEDSSPNKSAQYSGLDKDTRDKRKSSFDVSFQAKKERRNPQIILDHLNITRRDSGTSRVKKKSSTDLKYASIGSDNEDSKPGRNFVTLRRPRECHTMIDFDTGDSLGAQKVETKSGEGGLKKFKNLANLIGMDDSIVLSDKSLPEDKGVFSLTNTATRDSSPKNSILKKSMGTTTRSTRRDTYEIAECFYESLTRATIPPKTDVISAARAQPERDIFEVVSRTPTVELGKMLIGSGESFIMDSSILNESNRSTVPRLTRTSTYTKLENTPLPTRKSTRKRWSQADKIPISDLFTKENASINVSDQLADSTPQDTTVNQSKCVTIKTPAVSSPRKRWNKTTPKQNKAAERGKSVQIETPLNTPKIRPHSPLVMRKTPGPSFSGADDSILSGTYCTYDPQKTSTPHPKKKDVSLLKRVLTNEDSKSAKSVGKNSFRSKMPNFSKIHQRQNDKLENVKELLERKTIRAQYLLSGSKPPANTSALNYSEKESRKQLKFSPNKAESAKTAANISGLTVGQAKSTVLSKPLQRMLNKRVSLEKKKKKMKSKVPVAVAKAAQVPKAEPKPPINPQSKGVSRFGFKLPSGKNCVTKDEQIRAVTTKSKITANRTESNRKLLVGVRSNRRFELLMKMREDKNKPNTVSSRGFIYEPKKQFNVRPLKANPTTNHTKSSNGAKLVSKPVQHMLNKRALQKKKNKQGKSKIPVQIARSKATLPKVIKGSLDLVAKGFTRFNFKVPRGKENVTKAELIKAVTVKSKLTRDITEENRHQLKKVRGNRRFELLMTLRESNKRKSFLQHGK